MSRPPAFDPPGDPLFFATPLRHTVTLPVVGVPVRFESNSPLGVAAAGQAFGEWRALAERHPELVAARGPRVRIVVHDGDDPPDAPLRFRMPAKDVLLMHAPASLALVDVARREGTAYVTASLLADPMQVRHRFLPGVVLPLVCACDRAPVHAAAVARGDTVILLAGPPGTGKSTLSYAASAAGFRVLSDDAVYVQTAPGLRVWGRPGRSMLMPDAPVFFPELASHVPQVVADGTRKIVAEHAAAWPAGGAAAPVATRAVVCLVRREGAGGAIRRERVSAEEARATLRRDVGLTTELLGPAFDAALERLVPDGGAWRLSLSDNPREALPHLEELLELHGAPRS